MRCQFMVLYLWGHGHVGHKMVKSADTNGKHAPEDKKVEKTHMKNICLRY